MDTINVCDKRYLKMCMVEMPEAEDSTKRMKAHAMVGESKLSWATTYKELLEDNIRVHEVKSYKK